MKKDVKTATMQDVVKSIELANVAYEKREKASYTKVSKALEDMNNTVTCYNNTEIHKVWDKCVTVEDFVKTARTEKLAVKLNKEEQTFKTEKVKTLYSLASFAAWQRMDNVEVMPEGWTALVKTALAELAGTIAHTTEDINDEQEIKRINDKYKVNVTGSKKACKHALQALVDKIMPGYTVTGSDVTKVMLGTFKVNTLTWKIILPAEETLIKVFTGMLAAMVNKQDVNDIFEWDEQKEDTNK